jgi:hypothetical protein
LSLSSELNGFDRVGTGMTLKLLRMACIALLIPHSFAVAQEDMTSGASPDRSSIAPRVLPGEIAGVTETIIIDDARIYLLIEDRPFDVSRAEFRDWVTQCARIVSQYYGAFPVDEVYVAIRGRRGARVFSGTTFGRAGPAINVDIGLMTTRPTLDADWIMIHEMIHLAFPGVPRQHHWIEEGLSVYVESIARANAGDLSPESVWFGFLDGMPNGLPRSGDKGLDNTPTWGRTYWGGALFCLLADIRIREATGGKKTLRDALRGIVDAGYDITAGGDLGELLMIADQATGVSVLTDLYGEMGDQPGIDNLESLWAELGISRQGQTVVFDDQAPLAKIRRELTARED